MTAKEILEKNGFDFEAFELDNEYSAKNLLRAMELYAESKATEAYNQGVRDAADNATVKGVTYAENGSIEKEDDLGQEVAVDLPNFYIAVSKQSILKLLKTTQNEG